MSTLTVAQLLGATPIAIFGITPALLIALGAALLVALAVTSLHAWLSISVRADQIISGTIINIAAFGLTTYLNTIVSKNAPISGGSFAPFKLPTDVTNIPVLGTILGMFLNQGPITMSVLILVVLAQILLFRSRWGLRTRAVGEHPKAAETVGIDVIRLRYRNVLAGGLLAGLGGALGAEILGLDPVFPLKYMIYFLIVVTVGGTSSITGPFLASILLGIGDVAGKYYVPQVGAFVIYTIMIVVLIWRPQGLFARQSAR